MNGYEATTQIRKISTTIPIIAITAHAFPEDKERILNSGFNDYLSKPIKFKELQRKIQETLRSTYQNE